MASIHEYKHTTHTHKGKTVERNEDMLEISALKNKSSIGTL